MEFLIDSQQALEDAVEHFGILPFFRNSIPGFSISEHVPPELWFTDQPGPWEWKGPVIRGIACAYGKFFEKKAAYVSKEWFRDLANFRRDGYDFDARFDDGLASYQDKQLFEQILALEPVTSTRLKRETGYGRDGRKGFDTVLTRLMMEGYVLISDFVYQQDSRGRPYGWGVAEYQTPERFFGLAFSGAVYERSPQESYTRLREHLRSLFPEAEEKAISRFLRG